ncbi:MAG: hypothetical protein IT179_07310 [Acidobacteria bacterium]|nr:hypothetical protein [Acidobacteriota bacterium]
MAPSTFARALVKRLSAILPDGYAARADGDTIHVHTPGGPGASTSVGHLDPAEAEADDYADAAWNVLSMAQDVVSESTADPWPAPAGADEVPEPGAGADGRVIRLWFGAEDAQVLRLPPITLEH